MYDDVINDPKVQLLPVELFKAWINVLCLASRHGGELPPIDEMAFCLRMPADEVERVVAELIGYGLIDQDGDKIRPHNWNGRQFISDSSTQRSRKHRGISATKKDATLQQRPRNVAATADATPPDTDTETHSTLVRQDALKAEKPKPQAKETSQFDALWAIYPKRSGNADKKGALKAFNAALKRADLETIMHGIRAYSAWCKETGKTGTEHVKQCRSWLNGDFWTEWIGKSIDTSPHVEMFPCVVGSPQWDAWAKHNGKSFPVVDLKLPSGIKRGWWTKTEYPDIQTDGKKETTL